MQKHSSANTSVNSSKLPATFSRVQFQAGTVNLDYGGGKFDNVTKFLQQKGVHNYVYDPYNRTSEHNRNALRFVAQYNGADTVTCNNVLNVIDDDDEVDNVIKHCAEALKPYGTAYFLIYEGDRSGIGKVSKKDCYQRNQKAEAYMDAIRKHFKVVERTGKLVTAYNIPDSVRVNGKELKMPSPNPVTPVEQA